MKRKKKTPRKTFRAAARRLITDPLFLFRVVQAIAEMGIVGEKRNILVLFLAALTKDFDKSVSVLEKGASSTGKSEVIKSVIRIIPSECVLMRASLSKMAPVHGAGDLSGKILCIAEYRGAKDASYLTRLLQSEGQIDHEYATAVGRERGTVVVSRRGSPVVFTTTTRDRVFEDDETRFLSIQADDSPEQTQDVIAAHFSPDPVQDRGDELPVWHEAIRLLGKKIPKFRHPEWFNFLAREIPPDEPRARRDAVRFLSLLKAVALCLSHSDGRIKESPAEIEIKFSDYCVAHRVLSRAFTSTFAGVHPRALRLSRAIRRLHKQIGRPVSVKELIQELDWDQALVYKYVKIAEKQNLVQYEGGSHLHNLKRLQPGLISRPSFLPDPNLIFQRCPAVGNEVRYIDPLTGKEVAIRRDKRGTDE
jgi:DNA primase